jgi:hypothetical protein
MFHGTDGVLQNCNKLCYYSTIVMSMNTINIIYLFAFATMVISELACCYFPTADFSFGALWETG